MRKSWRMVWCLIGMSSLYGAAGSALGQYYAAPQYPQYAQYPQAAPPVAPAVPAPQVALNVDQMDQLLAPIALYPDLLLSLIFPAATYPQDVAAAAQWLAANPNPTAAGIDAQSWDASVKGLVHYPTVLNMLAGQIDWTQAVGAAFVNQQQEVMDSIQRLRAQAQAANNLQTTTQEQIVNDDGSIRIEPVDPNVIYVPMYDPNLVYDAACPITFGSGFPIGLWCDNDFDWHHHDIVRGGGWYAGWHHPVEWDRHPPAWNHRPEGWRPDIKPWVRAPLRPAPRLLAAAVNHLGLDRPRGLGGARPDLGRRLPVPPIGREPVPQPGRGAFEAAQSREEVQRAEERAHPNPVVRPEPARPLERAEPAPREPERTPLPRAEAPAPQPEPSAFSGGAANQTRAESARGNSSSHR